MKSLIMKKKRLIIAGVALVLLALIIWTAWGNTALELNTYTVSSKELPDAFDGYRIAHISDLHNAELGDSNEKLLSNSYNHLRLIICIYIITEKTVRYRVKTLFFIIFKSLIVTYSYKQL